MLQVLSSIAIHLQLAAEDIPPVDALFSPLTAAPTGTTTSFCHPWTTTLCSPNVALQGDPPAQT